MYDQTFIMLLLIMDKLSAYNNTFIVLALFILLELLGVSVAILYKSYCLLRNMYR